MSDHHADGRGLGRGHEEESTSSSSPVTACRRCRKQKLRCSRDLPTCKRCKDISAVCDYPPPPDRKLLAAQRLQNAKARAHRDSASTGAVLQEQLKLSDDGPQALPSKEFGSSASHPSLVRTLSIEESEHEGYSSIGDYRAITPPLRASLKKTSMPSSEIAMFLIEIYFSHLYNAHLLFHKETFLSEYAANKVPEFLTLSIFASASVFLRQSPRKPHRVAEGYRDRVEAALSTLSAADWTRQGDDWANAAGRQALTQCDLPRLEIVQGCQCLALYWWAVGARERTHIQSHIAYMNARLLGLHVEAENTNSTDILSEEIKRRCFWACWINQCIGQENASFKSEPWKDAIGLKLPSDENSWHSGYPSSTEVFDDKGNIVSFDGSEITPIASEMGELMKLIGLWWEVQRFVKQLVEETTSAVAKNFAGLLELDRRLGKTFDGFHPDLRYNNATTFTSPKIDKYRLFALHCIYRSSMCVLHSSIVPLFSSTTTNSHVSKKAVRLSAEESVKHALVILEMATAFMSTHPEISRLPSFTGFAMFVASTIQFKSLGAQRKLQMYGTSRFRAAISVLGQLKDYWDSLEGLWSALKSLFAPAGINVDNMPTIDPPYAFYPDDQLTDLDKIVCHEGTPQNDAATLYTYVATQEAKGASPRRSSDGYAHTQQSKSAQNTPSPGSVAINAEERQVRERTLPIHQRQDGQINPNAQSFAPRPQIPSNPQHQIHQRPYQGFEEQAFNTGGNMPQQGSMNAVGANVFVPLGTVPEVYQAQTSTMQYRSMGPTPGGMQSMDAFGNIDRLVGTEMDIDGMNLWWDQSYGTFDMEIIDPNARVEGGNGPYQFENFSFEH